MKKVLVVAAHADDETLGCGGSIARHISEGDSVTVVFMTDGVSSRNQHTEESSIEREGAAHLAMQVLGVDDVRQLCFPDNKMDSVPLLDITQVIESIIQDIKPEVIYTHFAHDLNIDHRITHQAVITACRPQKGSSVSKILTFEVLSSTEWNSVAFPAFQPNYIVDIHDYWEKKLQALKCYQEEMRDFPHSRSVECIKALAILRGGAYGFEKAEAFCIVRMLMA